MAGVNHFLGYMKTCQVGSNKYIVRHCLGTLYVLKKKTLHIFDLDMDTN